MTDYNLKNKHNEIIKYFSSVFLFEFISVPLKWDELNN